MFNRLFKSLQGIFFSGHLYSIHFAKGWKMIVSNFKTIIKVANYFSLLLEELSTIDGNSDKNLALMLIKVRNFNFLLTNKGKRECLSFFSHALTSISQLPQLVIGPFFCFIERSLETIRLSLLLNHRCQVKLRSPKLRTRKLGHSWCRIQTWIKRWNAYMPTRKVFCNSSFVGYLQKFS